MEKSKVYFTNLRCKFNSKGLLDKFRKLLIAAGIENIDFEDKFTAIKIHFGEPGNLAFLRPNYSKVVADIVKENGGKPFLTDCNTLYVGGRKNAIEHMEAAYLNGYSPFSTGCHVIIADGLKGNDDIAVPVNGGEYIKEAKIGRAIMDADVFIALSHFKGHENTGFGGALKNIGMGCGSRAGKMDMHSAGKPFAKLRKCVGCGACVKVCAHGAPTFNEEGKIVIDENKCVGCGRCVGVCPKDAIVARFDQANDVLNCKIAEYSKAVVDGRPAFYINLVIDVSPFCDCHMENDLPIVPDVGMYASFDPVALDVACVDAVNAQPAIPGSLLAEHHEHEVCSCGHGHATCDCDDHEDHFHAVSPETNWRACIDHAVKIGLGSDQYEIIEV